MKHHGGADSLDHHAGDLGNMKPTLPEKTHLIGKVNSVSAVGFDHRKIGRGAEKEDDLKTDPSGNSGARVACGRFSPLD